MNFILRVIIQIASTIIISIPAFAEIQTIIHTIQQPFGGSQSPDDALTAGIARVKREALEQFGTYIESTTVVKNAQIDSDEILALTAGVTRAEVIKQKNYADGNAFSIEITVKVELDTTVLEASLKKLLEDRNHLKDLKDSLEREKQLLAQLTELQIENQQKGKNKQQTALLREKFQAASQGLTAMEWFNKAIFLWDGEKYSYTEKAIEYLNQAIRLDPNYAAAYSNRGNAYYELKKFDYAIADHNQAIRLDPNYAAAYSNRGNAYYELKKFDHAIVDHNQAISLDPNYAKAYNNRGNVYYELKKFDFAITDFDNAIRLDPNYAAAYSNRGNAYYELKKFDHAIIDHDQAIRLDPNYAMAYNNRGAAYVKLKKFDFAITDFDNAIRLDSNYAMAYNNRGAAYVKLKKFDFAIIDFDNAIRLDSNYANAYNNRGKTYLKLNNAQKGCVDTGKACSLGVCKDYESFRQAKRCR